MEAEEAIYNELEAQENDLQEQFKIGAITGKEYSKRLLDVQRAAREELYEASRDDL